MAKGQCEYEESTSFGFAVFKNADPFSFSPLSSPTLTTQRSIADLAPYHRTSSFPTRSNRTRFRNLFPGFGIAVVAFTGYVIYDETVKAAKAKVDASRQGVEGTH
ncbi:BZ3500_MvSof-1268-A1-R1_Chr9g10585 [Microbotryum saponariae]|uniref:BZ3500_MvSof-1268-A1-R1_Chr9g10585 protein n=1 Tax=Microbotryum saponariae TaxID=289078 RepID=A0A2X0MES3_9BASI|nr:BZ3501_MvSof-1269-A2-R1_Chr9g10333 [Microbotryum saponariae]SDA00340.1 BZ3500_MvSof-1268-A1-R1_Chr9g10585 [Microbotryum saponariae]